MAATEAEACKIIWDSFPVEIQIYILEALLFYEDYARYASICRAWQEIIELKTFACLKVTLSRLTSFSDIGYRHRFLVKYIWFSIEPSDHQCPHCGGIGIPNWRPVSTKTIRKAIQDLIIQLSIWEPTGSLSLDISVKAPSALKHSSNTIQYGPGFISAPKKAKIIQCSYWLHNKDLHGPASYLINKVVTFIEPELKCISKMPKARAVTSLFLRRQTRRYWNSEGLEELLYLLPELCEFHYEP